MNSPDGIINKQKRWAHFLKVSAIFPFKWNAWIAAYSLFNLVNGHATMIFWGKMVFSIEYISFPNAWDLLNRHALFQQIGQTTIQCGIPGKSIMMMPIYSTPGLDRK